MRNLVAIFLMMNIAFSYSDPPHFVVKMHNDALADSLLGSACANESEATYEDPVKCAEAGLLAAYPSVDARISAANETYAIWRYAYSAVSKSKTVSDSHGCTSTYHKTFQDAEIFANISADFLNSTYVSEEIDDNPVLIPAPLEILDETDGDGITIAIDAAIVFHYRLDKTVSAWSCVDGECSCVETTYPSEEFDIVRNVGSSMEYIVEGGELLHFLNKPVLGEQWARNSEFEDIAFSNRRLYLADVFVGNESIGNASFYEFNITSDQHGVWSVISYPVSNSTNLNVYEIEERVMPVPIEQVNESFSYIYVFGSRYTALGLHNITLAVLDQFGNHFSKTFEIANRLITFGNSTAENGETDISDLNSYRPSKKENAGSAYFLVAGSAAIVLLGLIIIRR